MQSTETCLAEVYLSNPDEVKPAIRLAMTCDLKLDRSGDQVVDVEIDHVLRGPACLDSS